MKLTKRNIEALIAARDKGSPFFTRYRNIGGAYGRMVRRLTDAGLLDDDWRITNAGLKALQEIDRKALGR